MLAETSGVYRPSSIYLEPYKIWLADTMIFIIAAVLLGIAAQQARLAFQHAAREIEERRRTEAALQEKTGYLTALHETTLAIINRLN